MRYVIREIDTAALQHNFNHVKKLAPHSKVLAMIKANAYGHGALNIARALPQCDAFGVAHLEEALSLRQAGINAELVLMSSYLTQEQLIVAAAANLQWVIHDAWQIALLQQTRLPQPLTVWLKIDTGMHRLGFPPHQAKQAWLDLQACENVNKSIPLMTHFSCADEIDNPTTLQQISLFNQVTRGWPGMRSLANSAGILAWPPSHADWVRPGIMLYGISPFATKCGSDLGLKPVMRLQAPLLAIHQLQAGESIGYGQTYRCPASMLVGVIGMGYGDGYPRQAPTGTPVALGNTIVPLIGRVSMDMITVDLRPYSEAQVGEYATLWGPELPIETLAQASGVFVYQLACGVETASNNL